MLQMPNETLVYYERAFMLVITQKSSLLIKVIVFVFAWGGLYF